MSVFQSIIKTQIAKLLLKYWSKFFKTVPWTCSWRQLCNSVLNKGKTKIPLEEKACFKTQENPRLYYQFIIPSLLETLC